MSEYWRHLNWKALFIAFFGFYALPALCSIALAGWMLSSVGPGPIEGGRFFVLASALLWWWLLAPVGAGYLSARLAGRLPFLHALIVVVVGYMFQIAKINDAVWWLLPAWALVSVAGGFFGALVWQLQGRRQL